jgi:hypothetical protein
MCVSTIGLKPLNFKLCLISKDDIFVALNDFKYKHPFFLHEVLVGSNVGSFNYGLELDLINLSKKQAQNHVPSFDVDMSLHILIDRRITMKKN